MALEAVSFLLREEPHQGRDTHPGQVPSFETKSYSGSESLTRATGQARPKAEDIDLKNDPLCLLARSPLLYSPGSRPDRTEFESSSANSLTTPGLRVLTCTMGRMIVPHSLGCFCE